jgi:hypothetical protein
MVEVADEAEELAQALGVEGVEVDPVRPPSGPGRLGPEPLDETPLVVVALFASTEHRTHGDPTRG